MGEMRRTPASVRPPGGIWQLYEPGVRRLASARADDHSDRAYADAGAAARAALRIDRSGSLPAPLSTWRRSAAAPSPSRRATPASPSSPLKRRRCPRSPIGWRAIPAARQRLCGRDADGDPRGAHARRRRSLRRQRGQPAGDPLPGPVGAPRRHRAAGRRRPRHRRSPSRSPSPPRRWRLSLPST